MPDAPPAPSRRGADLRATLRAWHRDLGFLAVGLTVVYAGSGLAVNHLADWDPNFARVERVHELGPLPSEAPEAVARRVGERLAIRETPLDVFAASPTRLDVVYERRTLHVDPTTGRVVDEAESPRFFLRLANWLHLNRGKRAWIWFADGYAVLLLALAATGVFMLPLRRGLLGRGGLFLLAGVAAPVLYVVLSGGP
ncbi:MAG TPA: hypothetical protein VEI02_12165 [Planctomycetota bacterium]|nr:hypothetical protein [Planctomycetota bacterium]